MWNENTMFIVIILIALGLAVISQRLKTKKP